jgi:hypothetical protein
LKEKLEFSENDLEEQRERFNEKERELEALRDEKLKSEENSSENSEWKEKFQQEKILKEEYFKELENFKNQLISLKDNLESKKKKKFICLIFFFFLKFKKKIFLK